MTRTITKSQYQQLAALLSISGSNVQALCDLEEAVLVLLEIEPAIDEPNDYVQEAVFGDEHDVDELLQRLGIAVDVPEVFTAERKERAT